MPIATLFAAMRAERLHLDYTAAYHTVKAKYSISLLFSYLHLSWSFLI